MFHVLKYCIHVVQVPDQWLAILEIFIWLAADDATCGTPMWIGKGFTCVCFKPKGSYQRMCINLTPSQASV